MTGENTSHQQLTPTQFERETLLDLIDHSLEWMGAEGREVDSTKHMDVLKAMIEIRYRYRTRMPESTAVHLRKMIVAHACLVIPEKPSTKSEEILFSSLHSSLRAEYRDIEDSLSAIETGDKNYLPIRWQWAVDDVAVALGDLDGSIEE